MSTQTAVIESLKRRIEIAERKYQAAVSRGESESYLGIARFKLDELKGFLEAEEQKIAASRTK
ncbi:MAG: hypothetical protein ABJL57_06915 [Hyphomonas sp.]|uniref:hypothetical protein n=1 Tax=Hyphomonas sp. TaxID=87 RepID=UPI003298821F